MDSKIEILRIPVINILYFIKLMVTAYLEVSKILNRNSIRKRTIKPLKAPLISALLKDIWDEIQTAANKNT